MTDGNQSVRLGSSKPGIRVGPSSPFQMAKTAQ